MVKVKLQHTTKWIIPFLFALIVPVVVTASSRGQHAPVPVRVYARGTCARSTGSGVAGRGFTGKEQAEREPASTARPSRDNLRGAPRGRRL